MRWVKDGLIIVIIFGVFFLATDYLFGKTILDKINKSILLNVNTDNLYKKISHDVYHHDLKKNIFKLNQKWGELSHDLCTNTFGFKSSCDNIINQKDFDIVFIGDSMTEGVGLEYKDTFVGLFSKKHPELKIANMGVESYSPSIYRSKVQYFLERENMTFSHVFVFIDISDIQDEAIKYKFEDNVVIDQVQEIAEDQSLNLNTSLSKNFFRDKTPILYKLLSQLNSLFDMEERKVLGLAERAEWTYKLHSEAYGDKGAQYGINKSIYQMNELYKILKERNIDLSIGIYPLPNQIKFDVVDNLQAKIWGDFCKNKCRYFINTMPVFFNYLESNGEVKTYRDLYIYGDVHFNKVGNIMIFEEIEKAYR
jgi:hypothetical protein